MLRFIASVRDKYGYTAAQLDLGGGYGVRYTEDDLELDIATKIREVADRVKKICAELSLEVPEIRMEPGRSLVGDAGMTANKKDEPCSFKASLVGRCCESGDII